MKFEIENENDNTNRNFTKFKNETPIYAKVTHFAHKLKIAHFTHFLHNNDWEHAQIITNDFVPEKLNKKFMSNIEVFPNEKEDGLSVLVCFENFDNWDFKVVYRLSLLDGIGNVHFSKVNCNIARNNGKFSWENNINLNFILNSENQILINNVLNIFCEIVIVENYKEIALNHVALLDGFYYDQDQFYIVPVVRNYFNAKPKVIESVKHKWTIANISYLFDDKTNWGVNQIQSEKFCSTTNDKMFYFSLILCEKENGNLGIYLRSFTDENGELNIRFKFSLIEDQINKVGQNIFTQNKNTWGFEDFVSIKNLLERTSILNYSIKIICEIEILDENQSQIGEPNQSLSESFSNAKFRVIKSLAHKWTIDNFRQFYNQNQQNQQKVDSNKFSFNNDLQFQLRLYPNGKDKKHRNSLSLFLRHFSKEKVNLNVRFKMSILNENDEKKHSRDRQRKFLGTNDYWGFVDFISLAKLLDQTNGLLFDGKLIINCEIQILEDANLRCKPVKNLSNQLSESYLNVCPKLDEVSVKSSAASTTPILKTFASKTSTSIASNLNNDPIETALQQIYKTCDDIIFCKYAHHFTIKNVNINDFAHSSKTFLSQYFSPPNSPDDKFRLEICIFRIGFKDYVSISLNFEKKFSFFSERKSSIFSKSSFRFNYTIIGPDGEQTVLKDKYQLSVMWSFKNLIYHEIPPIFLRESNTFTLQLKIASIETDKIELSENEIKEYLNELYKLKLNEDEITYSVTNSKDNQLSLFQPKTLPLFPNCLDSLKPNSVQSKTVPKILAPTASNPNNASIKFGKCAHRWTIENFNMNDYQNANKIFISEQFSHPNSHDIKFQLKIYILNKRNDNISVYLSVDKKINTKLTYRYNYSIIDADGKATFLKDELSTSCRICLNKNMTHEEFESKFLFGSNTLTLQLKIVSIEETSETKLSETEIKESLDKLYKLDLNLEEITSTMTNECKKSKGIDRNSLSLNTEKPFKKDEELAQTSVSIVNPVKSVKQHISRSCNPNNFQTSNKFAHRWTIKNLNMKDFLDSAKIFESNYFLPPNSVDALFRLELNIWPKNFVDCVSIFLKVDSNKSLKLLYRYSFSIIRADGCQTVLKDEHNTNFGRVFLIENMIHDEFKEKILQDTKTLTLYLKVVSIEETSKTLKVSQTQIKLFVDEIFKQELNEDEITYTLTNESKENSLINGNKNLLSNCIGKSDSFEADFNSNDAEMADQVPEENKEMSHLIRKLNSTISVHKALCNRLFALDNNTRSGDSPNIVYN